jgi:endoglycosylceramidase
MRSVVPALALVAGSLVFSGSVPSSQAATELPSASFLHVGPVGGPAALPQIVDSGGRAVLLKGVNADGLVDYYRPDLKPPYPTNPGSYSGGACPPDDPTVEGVDICQYDFSQLGALGYDVIRLNISWSLLEPTPGTIDQTYLDRIEQVVAWARGQGIYVVIDMHQDAWSKYIYTAPGEACVAPFQAIRGFDGAPRWASQHVAPACALNGVRELDPAVQEDFQKLYDDVPAPDGVGLQEHYAAALLALAQRFHEEPTVAGYEIINEPSPGYNAVPGAVDATELFPFYGKVVNNVVSHVPGFRQLFFIEPNVERDVTDQSAIVTPWSAYSPYPDVVYAPHVYTGVFTLDQQVASTRFFPSDGGYKSAISDAKALGLPLWIGEFGNNPADDNTILRTHYELQDLYDLGDALWLWKENANDVNRAVFWGVYGPPFPPGTPQPLRIRYTSRAFPLYTAGHLRNFVYDPSAASFDLEADSPPVPFGARNLATVIFVPSATSASVSATGARLQTVSRGDGTRIVYAWPTGGPYRVFTCHEGDGNGQIGDSRSGTANFNFDNDPCDDGAPESMSEQDSGLGTDFHSTQVQSVTYDDTAHSETVTGLGTDKGVPVTFAMVAVDSELVPGGLYRLVLSDGYSRSGTLTSGVVKLH